MICLLSLPPFAFSEIHSSLPRAFLHLLGLQNLTRTQSTEENFGYTTSGAVREPRLARSGEEMRGPSNNVRLYDCRFVEILCPALHCAPPWVGLRLR
jgi:hypothetical protein